MPARTLAALLALTPLAAGAADVPSGLVDPMAPPIVAPTLSATLDPGTISTCTVTAIRIGGSANTAIVNGQLLRVGDQFNGARVVSITVDRVTLESERQRSTCQFQERLVKSRSKPSVNRELE